ncbi:MAG: trypsin-like peptidase domain-containing protein [Actinomycetota bacterium]|nr:trypsin-like peptidase domain-containing protein [Actinomycetota bacterium]
MFTAVIAAVNAAVAALFVVPLFFGTNPVDVLSNRQEDQVREVQEVTTVEERVIKADQEAVAEAAQKALPCTVNLEVEIGRVGVGIGSGFIYSPDGYIVTNNHVVEDATSITVALQDGTTFEAGIVGTDPETDLAVIKIDATGLPAVELGTSSDLAVGELAMAIGSPEGFQGSVTSGIISALNRNVYVSDSTPLLDVIQTDAAINPGNSGGPLCNIKGEVVGINTAIYSESGGYDGLGFAIPIDGARPVIEQLIETGVAVHPWLGFTGSTLETEVAERYGLPVDEGAIVRSVVEDAPAQKAGLEAGDIITAIDGTVVESMDQLMLELRKHQVGDTVTVDFYRGDEAMQARATLEEKPAT